ncbi:MAG TPA: hypothetical protein V6C72_12040 [Chroococcales cyanobacterium]
MNIQERITAMRATHAIQRQPAPIEKKIRVEQAKSEVAVEKVLSTEKDFDIANNPVAKIMNQSDLSDKGKLEAVVEFLCAKDDDYHAAQGNFAALEVYFTYEQSKRTQVSEQNIQRLIDELEEGTKSMVKHILNDFNSVSAGAGKIKQLLTVMEKARVEGRAVEVLTAAYKFNEKLIKDISALKEVLANGEKKEAETQQRLNHLQGEKNKMDDHVLTRFFRAGSKRMIEDSLYYATFDLKSVQNKIAVFRDTLSEREGQRNKELEDGELTILRTIDATEGGLTDQILQTAKDSLALIKSTRISIERLLSANAKSRAACTEITRTLKSMAGGETVLKGALHLVAKETHLQGKGLKTRVDKLNQSRAEAAGDEARLTLATVEFDKLSQTEQGALDYERVLQTKIVSFEMLASANVQAEARAQQFATLVESQHELLSNLEQQALPVTASALEMGLQQGVALRDGMLAAGVRDATNKAQAIFGSNLEGATGAQTRLESENLDQMRAAIVALGKAQALIVERTDKAIERGLTSLELVDEVTASAEAVRAAMSDFQKADSVVTSRDEIAVTSAPLDATPTATKDLGPEQNQTNGGPARVIRTPPILLESLNGGRH